MGVLSIGEEESKGNELTKEAFKLIKELPLNFVGNVEGRDLFNGKADVLVCDGFVGNVALKISEGMAETVRFLLKQSLQATITRQVGFMLSRQAFVDFKKRLDYSEYGGAPLLGVKGVCIISHGSSNANAIKNAIRVASEFANSEMNRVIEKEIADASSQLENQNGKSARSFACRLNRPRHGLAGCAPISAVCRSLHASQVDSMSHHKSPIAFMFPGQGSQARWHGPRTGCHVSRGAGNLRRGRRGARATSCRSFASKVPKTSSS